MYWIRSARDHDLVRLAQIDRSCFGRSWDDSAYKIEFEREHAWIAVCQQKVKPDDSDSPFRSAMPNILGGGVLWTIGPEAELIRLAVRPENQRQGVGRAILRSMMQRCQVQVCECMHLEVAARNVAAIRLYTSMGFVKVGLRRAYYQVPTDDAIRMSCSIGAAQDFGQ